MKKILIRWLNLPSKAEVEKLTVINTGLSTRLSQLAQQSQKTREDLDKVMNLFTIGIDIGVPGHDRSVAVVIMKHPNKDGQNIVRIMDIPFETALELHHKLKQFEGFYQVRDMPRGFRF